MADAASETLDLYGQLPNAGGETFHEAQQIVCGKNATFVIKSNGDVYSCGEGSNGRLGHGHSDDIGNLQIISGKCVTADQKFQKKSRQKNSSKQINKKNFRQF